MHIARRSRIFLGLFIPVCGVLAFLVSRQVELKAVPGQQTPITATVMEERYSPDSTRPNYVEYIIRAVRSDGSWVVINRRQAPDGRWVEMKLVTDLASSKRITVDPTTESLVTYELPKGTPTLFFQAERGACSSTSGLQHSTMLGYDVVEYTEPFGPPGGTDTLTTWLAPGLGCFPLREVYKIAVSGGGWWKTVRQTLFVIPGEPSAELFRAPSNYTERSPGELNAEFKHRYPGHHAFPDVTANKLDKLYESNRSEH